MTKTKSYWLFKSEPDVFSIETLRRCPDSTDSWDGVRNYQARNFMRDEMRCGDLALFYHSNCAEPGVVGIAEVTAEAQPDSSAWNRKSPYFDPKASPDNPIWCMVSLTWRETFARVVSLREIKADPKLQDMLVARRGNRLSITPVSRDAFAHIRKLAQKSAAAER